MTIKITPITTGRPPAKPHVDDEGTSDRVVEAAIPLFGAQGYGATSIREICAAASVNQGLISYYFPGGKKELWKTCAKLCFERAFFDSQLYTDSVKNADVKTRLESALRSTVYVSAKHPSMHRFVQTSAVHGDTELLEWISENHIKAQFSHLITLIEEAQAAGLLVNGDPIVQFYMILGACGLPYWTDAEVRVTSGREVFKQDAIREHADMLVATFVKQ